MAALQRDERPRAERRVGRVPRPRSAAGGALQLVPEKAQGLGVALPHRPLDAQPATRSRSCCPTSRTTPQSLFHMAEYVPDGDEGRRQRRAAGDRPADAEEHGALARGRGLRVRAVRDRRRPAADVPGLALRPLEGPAGRDRRLPHRQGGDARRAARAGRLDGQRRPRGLGLLQRHDRPRRRRPRRAHPQQLQQRRSDRGQRLPVARRRADPEVHARGLRADGLGGDLEGAAVHRRQRRRHPAADRGRRHRLPGLERRAVRAAHARDPARPGARAGRSGGAARSTCASTSSRPATCATTCGSSRSSWEA